MSKLKKNFIKKIIPNIFIVYMALMTSNSLCMLTVFTKPLLRSSKPLLYTPQRTFCSMCTVSEQRCKELYKENKKNLQRLSVLRKDPYANLREIWRLEDTIKYNHRALIRLKKRISDETTE